MRFHSEMCSSHSSPMSERVLTGSLSHSTTRSSPPQNLSPYIRKKRAKRTESWRFESHMSGPSDLSPQTNPNTELHRPPQVINSHLDSLIQGSSWNECAPSSGLSSPQELSDDEQELDAAIGLLENFPPSRHPLKEAEMTRLRDILQILTRTMVSKRDCGVILNTNVIASRFSYYQLETYAKERCGLTARSVRMCPTGHMAQAGRFKEKGACQTPDCGKNFTDHHKFWFSLPSEQLRAMCFERESFHELFGGFKRAKDAVCEEQGPDSVLHDYYDGSIFLDNFTGMMNDSDPSKDVTIFMTLSTDGVELFKGKDGECTCWPVMLTILNIGVENRFRAANSLLTAFIPGSHDGNHFDTFLHPLVEDLLLLQDGMHVLCADGNVRLMRAFVLFCTADWPGATKLSGFAGHNASRPCRLCLRQTTNRVVMPTSTARLLQKALLGEMESLEWLEAECPDRRTEQDIKQVWELLDESNRSSMHARSRTNAVIMKNTGIKRRPVLSELSLKFPNAFPYDCMHLLLQGWVKLLINLLCGIHPKTIANRSPFVIGSDSLARMNNTLQHSLRGFPASWGRAPPPIENIASYKAETFKTFGIFYGPALFSGPGISGRVTDLWVATRDMLLVAFDPTPSLNDVKHLSKVVQRAHALFTKVFLVSDSQNFCFTPTTHAILHLPEIIRSCGPLMNTSQFLPERVMGEVKRQAQSRVLPESNLFHKSQMLFGMRMFNGGLRTVAESADDSGIPAPIPRDGTETESILSSEWKLSGKGEMCFSNSVIGRLFSLLKGHDLCLQETTTSLSAFEHKSAKCVKDGIALHIETDHAFREREKRASRKAQARQKCWIAAEFGSDDVSSEDRAELTKVYYGKVLHLWSVTGSTSNHECFQVAEIEWQNGLSIDSKSGTVSTKTRGRRRKGTIRDTTVSLEMIGCIKRLVAFLDHGEKRYFFDMCSQRTMKIFNSELRGVMRE